MLLGPQIIERFKGVEKNASGEISDGSARSRLVIISSQYEMFKESPLFGQGHRTTLILSPYYISQEYLTSSSRSKDGLSRRASHNFIMGMLTDHGIIGVGIYLLIVITIARHLFELKKYIQIGYDQELIVIQTGLCLSFLCYLIAGLFSNNKIFEIAVWLIAIIPVVDHLIKQSSTDMNQC